MQQDAHELVRLLLNELENEMRCFKASAGLVKALYEGNMATQVKCLACGYVRNKYRDIVIQMVDQENLVTSLFNFTRPKSLSGDNQ